MVRKFTQNNDIKMIIQEKQISTNQIRSILKKKGIFSLVSNADELSKEIYPLYFGSAEVDKMKELMQTESNYKKSSLMTIVSKEDNNDIDNLLENIEEQFLKYRTYDKKYKIETIITDKSGQINLCVSYIKKIKGKVNLIKDKKKELGVILKKDLDSSRILVDIRQNDNSDLKEFEKFLEQVNSLDGPKDLFKIEHLSLDKLTRTNKIKFFDNLIAYRYDDWNIEDIKGIDVKRVENIEDDEDGDEVLSSDELIGITNAMFKGYSIRNTGIVKKFENQGFYFTSMKFKYRYKNTTENFIIDINFKGTENVKIDIINTYDDMDKVVFPMTQQEEIIQKFQEVVNKVYKDIINEQEHERNRGI